MLVRFKKIASLLAATTTTTNERTITTAHRHINLKSIDAKKKLLMTFRAPENSNFQKNVFFLHITEKITFLINLDVFL